MLAARNRLWISDQSHSSSDQDLSQRLRYRDYLGAGLSLSSTRGRGSKARPQDGVIHVAGNLVELSGEVLAKLETLRPD